MAAMAALPFRQCAAGRQRQAATNARNVKLLGSSARRCICANQREERKESARTDSWCDSPRSHILIATRCRQPTHCQGQEVSGTNLRKELVRTGTRVLVMT